MNWYEMLKETVVTYFKISPTFLPKVNDENHGKTVWLVHLWDDICTWNLNKKHEY